MRISDWSSYVCSSDLPSLADRDVPFAFNRKEAKDHGEGGVLVGAPLQGKVVIIDDVITAGTSVRESVDIIRQAGAEPAAVLIAQIGRATCRERVCQYV